jgi:hypothetical protein
MGATKNSGINKQVAMYEQEAEARTCTAGSYEKKKSKFDK